MKQVILTALTVIAACSMTVAQNWQWGKRGGGGVSEFQSGSKPEQANDIAVDKNGNVYVLFQPNADQNDLNVDGHNLTGYGYQDIVLSSFKCDGSYRWSKVIGTHQDDIAVAVKADTLGGIYVTGVVRNWFETAHFSTDTTITSTARNLFLVKYDTAGTYKWLRRPQSDTCGYWTTLQGVVSLDMDIDESGNTYILSNLAKGLYGGVYSVSSAGLHILKYDNNGAFLGGVQLSATYNVADAYLFPINLKKNPANGKFIITGSAFTGATTPMYFGTTKLSGSMVVGSFNANGTFDWLKQSSKSATGELHKPAIDAAGNLYLAGKSLNGDAFGGVTFSNASPFYFPLLFKLDANGNTVWSRVAVTASGENMACALLTNGEIVTGGIWAGTMKWNTAGDSIVHNIPNYNTDPFITRFNATTGSFIKMDTLGSGFGQAEEVTVMLGDRKGNLYMGGDFSNTLKVAATTLTAVSGGDREMFIAKYGYANCNCTAIPVSNFTSSNTSAKTVQFTYSGTTASIDSVVWAFGDGQKQKVTANYAAPVSHSYATNGSYPSCATVYSACGSNQYCRQVALSAGSSISAMEGVKVYPNPANDYLMIEGAAGADVTLINSVGQHVTDMTLNSAKQAVNTSGLPPGIYILILQNKSGQTATMRIVRQ